MLMKQTKSQHEACLKRHADNFQYEVKDLRAVAKERHIMFIEEVDIIVDAIIRIVELFSLLITKIDSKTEFDTKVFSKLEEFLGSWKESLSKLHVSPPSSISQESLSKMLSTLENNLKVELAPVLQLVKLMATDAPFVKIWVQGGEKGGWLWFIEGYSWGKGCWKGDEALDDF
ncbi:unnamed protein product [Lactuca saligna]|uniref:Uncharacterized protein n=1 Tax=Lactuca saligna TaxID=75948 RepID=A0AA35VL72_LACSI|nr:unnamed protein product [Lactuca saligna]